MDRNTFLQPAKRRYADVSIKDFGNVRIQSLTERERSKLEASQLDKNGRNDPRKAALFKSRLIAAVVVDSDGNLLLTGGDLDAILSMDATVTAKIFDAAVEHCGFSTTDVEELAGNSEATDDADLLSN